MAGSPKLNIEMTTYTTAKKMTTTYTSLRDLPPPQLPKKSSWYEIPITNPLVKHAATAYLHPMLTAPDIHRRAGLLARVRDACGCSEDGCLWWLGEALLRVFGAAYGNSDVDNDKEDDKIRFD